VLYSHADAYSCGKQGLRALHWKEGPELPLQRKAKMFGHFGIGMTYPATIPSREFMIQQATLNALHDTYKTTIPAYGIKTAGQDACVEIFRRSEFSKIFVSKVREAWRAIAYNYGVGLPGSGLK